MSACDDAMFDSPQTSVIYSTVTTQNCKQEHFANLRQYFTQDIVIKR